MQFQSKFQLIGGGTFKLERLIWKNKYVSDK